MSPIGNILLMNCESDMSIHLEKIASILPNVSICRVKAIARALGITIIGDS